MAGVTDRKRRRRRSPEEAQREIIDAAETLLHERPFRELTVDELMRRTGLSRPSFYVYFRDRHHLVLEVVRHLERELMDVSERWYRSAAPNAAVVESALLGVVGVYERHGPVLCALADAAADDPGVEEVYRELVRRFVDATAEHIEQEVAAGTIAGIEPGPTATALIHLNERYLGISLGQKPFADPAEVLRTLTAIWTRTLYGAAAATR